MCILAAQCLSVRVCIFLVPARGVCCFVSLDVIRVILFSLWGFSFFLVSSPCGLFNKQSLSVIRL